MGIIHHNKINHRKRYVNGKGVVNLIGKRHIHGRGIADQLFPLAWKFATNIDSAKNVGEAAVRAFKTTKDLVDIGKNIHNIKKDIKEMRRGSGFRYI